MRVAIDMTTLRVVQVHRVADILYGLVHLECGNVMDVQFGDTQSDQFLVRLKVQQMQTLFTNITGESGDALTYMERRAAITVAIEAMKPALVDEQEMDRQIEAVAKQLEGKVGTVPFFRYSLGAKIPKVADALFVRTIARDDKQRVAALGAAQRLQPLRAATTPATPAPGIARQKTGVPRATGAEPTGGVAGEVWSVADKLWEAAGSPRDVKAILVLRMRWMQILEEEHDIKRTTSSNTLGQWMKARLSKES